ncbi:malto-oligosyltrehalose synthase [Pedobacter aquatilis]|uniref:malto-oligosyltrehalose synthase n=1 Tax=Pedobacter aquatilis TaxID=351343 RepID=UPI0025B4D8A5|nr:malto-oligosyltrehalose synthase [Pedobacter aquatilis]MDN3588814.1 malto-oligosyltrehalose synthase [Pedobacter aquatilis]
MIIPSSTYRIQFHKEFNFADFEQILPYLKNLGVDTIYAAPIFRAKTGSTHGYDVTSPLEINPEIGTEKQLFELSAKLKELGIKWIQDIVPNHMSFDSDNEWLMDVLKFGKKSAYASYFDIDFSSTAGRLMVPFLGESIEEAIENKTLQIKGKQGDFFIHYGEDRWPVNDVTSKYLAKSKLPDINESAEELLKITEQQFYRLCHWQETEDRINYRRFFTVNALICTNIHIAEVFEHYHQYIFSLCEKGIFQGLRIDHIDGLYDIEAYLKQLRIRVGAEIFLVVEKILEPGEELPESWPVAGTTGYDFLSQVNNVLTNKAAEHQFDETYLSFTRKKQIPEDMLPEKKRAILSDQMQGELDNLCRLFYELKLDEELSLDESMLKSAIAEFLIAMPVYRFYDYNFPLQGESLEQLNKIINGLHKNLNKRQSASLLEKIFVKIPSQSGQDYCKSISKFYQRCMQFSGPLMAKGVEDTLMFTYNRFTAHNEVGDSLLNFGTDIQDFHLQMQKRGRQWPHSLNASSTHDTKRGEDFRARLNVLADIPAAWSKFVFELKSVIEDDQLQFPSFKEIHLNDLYLLLQTLIGIMPFDGEVDENFKSRIDAFIDKALREGKRRSDWASPDEDYEKQLKAISRAILANGSKSFNLMRDFVSKIKDFAIINSLAQTVLKCCAPGIPDFYQGSEHWDLSLVDPDNRRPVDFKSLRTVLKSLGKNPPLSNLWPKRQNGNIKTHLTKILLNLRKTHHELFSKGQYIPLKTTGKYANHLLAFARQRNEQWIVIVLSLGLAKIIPSGVLVEDFDWADSQIILPDGAPFGWKDLLNKTQGHKDILNDGILASQLFKDFPIALLEMQPAKPVRKAGILMHISSLSTDFGIGDLGHNARAFADFLVQAKQRYWQILPLNPTKSANGHSPYSSASAMAGNTLLIDPLALLEGGLINQSDLEEARLPKGSYVDFEQVEAKKCALLSKAFKVFKRSVNVLLNDAFEKFKDTERKWLDDYALYAAIKNHQNGKEWYHWPDDFKYRKTPALNKFKTKYAREIEEICWQQFIFFRQWHALKDYCNSKGIGFIGDLPFYVDMDSVEVWTMPEYFLLDKTLRAIKVAGVPPDYFNSSGQLWGMPIFNWAVMKKDNYRWWVDRLKQNLKLYDSLRLDHFRAFAYYWQVPANATNAISGEWKKGPGVTFFKLLEKEFPTLPFIAEDLGEHAPEVEALMEAFNLPGMRVLQFAFGEELPVSIHAPHNYPTNTAVYTGTHDNNTLRGWFRSEADAHMKKRLNRYFDQNVSEENLQALMLRMCYSSVAALAILPVQDILFLDESARMNVPGKEKGNWDWRLKPDVLDKELAAKLANECECYGRAATNTT